MDEALSVDEITPEAAVSLLARGAMLIDVREPEEWLLGRAPQAFHIPLGDLGSRLAELPRDRKLIMICRSGARSGRAAETLWKVDSGGQPGRWHASLERGLPARCCRRRCSGRGGLKGCPL